ncbi:1-deoxy-D-xylulose-5-phosphate synthase [Atopobiaceae bacterium 24-176]
MYLETIDSPRDLKRMGVAELEALAREMRNALIERARTHGGHLGPNLGVIELTIALHRVFDSPKDAIVFDVSHQTYAHKMLTGRKEAFLDPAHYDDVSGFSSPAESVHDPFVLGHTSTSIGLAAGISRGRSVAGVGGHVVAVIGDGSLSGGQAFEGLDAAGELCNNLVVVVNDNGMSIAENHGSLYEELRRLRETGGGCTEGNYFTSLGFAYRYVDDGNCVAALVEALEGVKDARGPQLVHVHTEKGCGFAPAVKDPEAFHNVGPLDARGSQAPKKAPLAWRDVTCGYLNRRMAKDPGAMTVVAGTPKGLGFTPAMRQAAGEKFVDVGIAEATAFTFAAGLACAGMHPAVCMYSTFLGRAYDQIVQEVGLNRSHVVTMVDRGSVWAMNDLTHLGLGDIAMLGSIPNITYLAPATVPEFEAMMDWALDVACGPVAVKVPGGSPVTDELPTLVRGSEVAFVGAGTFYPTALEAARILRERAGINATAVNPRLVSDVTEDLVELLSQGHRVVVTLEDGFAAGGFGQKLAAALGGSGASVIVRGFPKDVPDRFDPGTLVEKARMTPELVAQDSLAALEALPSSPESE